MFELHQKVALVTGASRGIGAAIAKTLGQAGATVIGTATSTQGAEQITSAFAAQGMTGMGVCLNVTEPQQIETTVAMVNSHYGGVDILVNNAGIVRDHLLMRLKDEDWDLVLNTNLTAIFRMTKAVIRGMIKNRWGRIISITSVSGFIGNPGQTNYAAAKAGIVGFTRSLASEVGARGITVNAIAPGFIATDMTQALDEAHAKLLISQIPLQAMGEPQDIANGVLFLASPAAAYITGETLHINGGLYMA